MLTGIKMIVTPNQSEEVQKIFFANGGTRVDGNRVIENTDCSMIFIDWDNKIWFLEGDNISDDGISDEDYFSEHIFTYVDTEFFIRTNGEFEYGIYD